MIKVNSATVTLAVAAISAALVAIGQTPGHTSLHAGLALAAAVIVVVLMFAPQQLSFADRFMRRRRFARPVRKKNIAYTMNNIATVWDGEAASMYVEMLPSPFQLTVLDGPNVDLEPKPLPVDLIRSHMIQGDLRLSAIRIITTGHRQHTESAYNKAYSAIVGDTPIPQTQRTVIEVQVNLEKSYPSILARSSTSVPAGIGKATYTAAARIETRLNIEGYEARLLQSRRLLGFHNTVLAPLNDGFKNEKWSYMAGEVPSVVAKPAQWSQRAAEQWMAVPADRMSNALTISPASHNRMGVDGVFAYTYADAAKLPEKPLLLRRAEGSQGDAATAALPLARTVSQPSNQLLLAAEDEFPLSLPAHGLGVYLGQAAGGGRAFVNFSCGGAVMNVAAPLAFVQQLAARITTTGASVGIYCGGDGWDEVATKVSPLIRITPTRPVAVAIYKDAPPVKVPESTAVIVWTPDGLPARSAYSIEAGEDGLFTIATTRGHTRFEWNASRREAAFIPALVG